MNRNTIRLIPLLIMLFVSIAIASGLFMSEEDLQSEGALVGYPIVNFSLPTLGSEERRFAPRDWRGKVVVLNIFASWCDACLAEHKIWMDLVKGGNIRLYGLAWNDTADNISRWLNQHGNPYHLIGMDKTGKSTIHLALMGAPETFIIDASGNIYFHHRGPITESLANELIKPLFQKLQKDEAIRVNEERKNAPQYQPNAIQRPQPTPPPKTQRKRNKEQRRPAKN